MFLARIRLEGTRGQNASRMYTAIEAGPGPIAAGTAGEPAAQRPAATAELQEGERRISALQRRLLQTTDRSTRQRLLEQIFAAEEQLAPASTAFFDRSRRAGPRTAGTLRDSSLRSRPDELFFEFALMDPASLVVVATGTAARVQQLPGRTAIAWTGRSASEDVSRSGSDAER